MNSIPWSDPIVAEVRAIREQHAAQFEYDLDAIYEDIKAWERASERTFASLPPRSWSPEEAEASPAKPAAG